MKRVSLVWMLLWLLLPMCCQSRLAAQENESSFLLIPGVEVNPYLGSDLSTDMGNTSLYTLFEGELGEYFSYSVANHWLSTDPASLYANTLRSDDSNWLDWANITAYLGNFDITAGKQGILFGSYEQDDYDYDVCFNLSSTVWNNVYTYNWGLALGYTLPSENTYFAVQVTTSPFAAYHLSTTGCRAYTFAWMGEYACYEPMWTLNVFEYEQEMDGGPTPVKGGNIYNFAAGNRFSFDDWQVDLEFIARSYDAASLFKEEISLIGSLKYFIDDKFDVMLKGGWESNLSGEDVFGYRDEPGFVPTSLADMDKDYFFGGVLLNYYPLNDSENLRIHGAVAANNYAKGVSVSLGATYYLDLLDIFQK